MKRILLILLMSYAGLLYSQTEIFDKTISIEFKNIKLKDALLKLQDVSEVKFAFNTKIKGMDDKINEIFTDVSLETILDNILMDKNIIYKLIGNQLVFYSSKRTKSTNNRGRSTISGKIVNGRTGEALSMINISILGSTKGAISDQNGYFQIKNLIPNNYSLLISAIGFKQKILLNVDVGIENTVDLKEIKLEEGEITLDEIIITPGAFSIMGSEPLSRQTLDRESFKNMSYTEDITRAVSRLPGISSNDFSSKFTVRGSETDEVLITLDGMELYDPFHQRDFSGGLFSIVDIETIQKIDLMTGGFSAEYGQRQSGVFKMQTKDVINQRRSSIGLSIINARLYTEGQFADKKGSYLISARRGMLDQTFKLIDETENIPIYYDILGKVEYKLDKKHTLSIHGLQAADKTEVRDVVPTEVDYDIHDTWYNNSYLWITLKSVYNPSLFSRSIIYGGHITHHRHGSAFKVGYSDKVKFRLKDKRKLDFGGIKQDWNWVPDKNLAIKGGIDYKKLFSEYRYNLALTDVRVNQQGIVEDYNESRMVNTNPDGDQFAAYLSSALSVTQKLF
ncbi:MAG: TonB-dependent receptor, partial [Melioribacteraceae bacterium]|nr:TonB-dependent receptor [Melioribacteraceae bacterium]